MCYFCESNYRLWLNCVTYFCNINCLIQLNVWRRRRNVISRPALELARGWKVTISSLPELENIKSRNSPPYLVPILLHKNKYFRRSLLRNFVQNTVANIFVPAVVSILTFEILTNLSEKLRGEEGEILLQFWGTISCGDIFLGLYINNTQKESFLCVHTNK